MLTRRAFVAGGAALVPACAAEERPLRERAAARGILYGAAASYPSLNRDSDFARRFAEECGFLVPENALKSGPLRPTPDRFDFEGADWLAGYAAKNRMRLRGHTLVWHQQLPRWFQEKVDKGNARQWLEEHIRTVAGRYRGRMHSWDVVNEAVLPKDGREDGLRKTPWLDRLGPDYLEIAYRAAAAADPDAMLVYNDYGIDYDQPEDNRKRDAILKLLRRLKDAKVPLDGFGCQAHLSGANRNFKPAVLREFFGAVAGLGLKILITELDVLDTGLPEDIGERDRAVAGAYAEYLAAALESPATVAVLTWGLSDRYTWLARRTARPSGTGGRVLPLDRDFKRKPAWEAIARAFDNRRAGA